MYYFISFQDLDPDITNTRNYFFDTIIDMDKKQESVFISYLMLPSRTMYRLYRWTAHWSKTKYGQAALFLNAFAESSFFPIPPDVLLIAMTVSNRFRWWWYALIATVGSVIGAILGYYIGYAFFDAVGQPIVDLYHLEKYFETVQVRYSQNAFLALFTAAFTPIPFKVFTLAAGVFQISIAELIFGSLLGRAGRFFAVALAIRIFGKQIEDKIERYFNILSILFIILLIGGFLAVRFL